MRACCLIALMLFWAAAASADPQSRSYSRWSAAEGQVEAVFGIAAREVTRLPSSRDNPDLAQVLRSYLDQHLHIAASGTACHYLGNNSGQASAGYLRVTARWQCPSDTRRLDIRITAWFDEAPGHLHFARFQFAGMDDFERIFTRRMLHHLVPLAGNDATPASPPRSETLLTYTRFGFEHILAGLDHIAFLLILLILAPRVRDILFIATGFTLGHSVTLSLTVLGWATPNVALVEAFIGFTIAVVAIENVAVSGGNSRGAALLVAAVLATLALLNALTGWSSPVLALLGLSLFSYCYLRLGESPMRARQLRPAISILFGLIHGFGFANVLLGVGLPKDALLLALFGFNLGVELGQVAIVLALATAGLTLRRLQPAQRGAAVSVTNTLLCALGCYWFVQRLYFPA